MASEAFRQAADAQAKSLAFNPGMIWVPHPIQNRSKDELAGIAETAIDEILGLISPTNR